MVQRHVARCVAGNYNQRSSITSMLGCLNWETLESHRTCLHLKLLHKMFTRQVAFRLFSTMQSELQLPLYFFLNAP